MNLGTIYYRQRKFGEAEKYYRAAIEADPAYPLAQFNLGNLYDEQGRLEEALEYYRRALQLNPHYADAHFNLALLCERAGRCPEGGPSLEGLPEAGQLRPVGRNRPPPVGTPAAAPSSIASVNG